MDAEMRSNAHVAADFTNASVTNAKFDGADLSADEKNQSMGLMRGAFNGANLSGSSFNGANLARVMMEFAMLRGADLTDANLRGGEFAATEFHPADGLTQLAQNRGSGLGKSMP